MSIERARSLVEGVGRLPVMPAQADGLLKLVADTDPDMASVLGVVERDPSLTAMVLRLVNSASFGLRTSVSSLRQAVVLLGTSHLRSLALAASMSQLFSGPSDSGSCSGEGDAGTPWEHAFAVACGARAIALELAPGAGEAAFAAGMLHDLGGLVLSSSFPEAAVIAEAKAAIGSMGRIDAEKEALGADHGELGAALAERWGLPAPLVTAVSRHHRITDRFENDDEEGMELASLVAISEALCVAFDLGPGDGLHDSPPDPLERLEAMGTRRPDALALRARDDIARHIGAGALLQSGR